jgi:hypothetical protein
VEEHDKNEGQGIEGRMIYLVLKKWEWFGVEWINLAQDRHKWQGLVDTALKLRFPQNAQNFVTY